MIQFTKSCLEEQGLVIALEKIQRQAPWKYLGWKILEQTIQPQSIQLNVNIRMLNDVQKLVSSINWVHTLLGIDNETLAPLFALVKGDASLSSPR